MPRIPYKINDFSGGVLAPRFLGRSNLERYYSSASEILNFIIREAGGCYRRPGTQYIAQGKTDGLLKVLYPWVFNETDAYCLEFGVGYIRFFRNLAQVMDPITPTNPYEIATPYTINDLRELHLEQSADQTWIFHESHPTQLLTRTAVDNWLIRDAVFRPPPSFEKELELAAALTVTAVSGEDVPASVDSPVFIASDLNRPIRTATGGRMIITTFTDASNISVDILDALPDTDPLPQGQWFLQGSPQTDLNLDKKAPVGGQVKMTLDADGWRDPANLNGYVKILGGVVAISAIDSPTVARGTVLVELSDTEKKNPDKVPEGAWTLEETSWSATEGYPSTGAFHEQRLGAGGLQTFWLSRSGGFDNFGTGSLDSDAISRTLDGFNLIRWLASGEDLLIGTNGNEIKAAASSRGEVLTPGDTVARQTTWHGSGKLRPISLGTGVIFVEVGGLKLRELRLERLTEGQYTAPDIGIFAEHLYDTGILQLVFKKSPDQQVWTVQADSSCTVMTWDTQINVQVRAAAQVKTRAGDAIESVTVIPNPAGTSSQVWASVKRTVDGGEVRYIEVFQDAAADMVNRAWKSLQTDSAVTYKTPGTGVLTGLDHLEGETVRIVADAGLLPDQVVTGGQVDIGTTPLYDEVEVGLGYNARVVTLSPEVPELGSIRDVQQGWDEYSILVRDAVGLTINGLIEQPTRAPSDLMDMGRQYLDAEWYAVNLAASDRLGQITLEQNDPYPLEILMTVGSLSVGDR